MRKNQTITSAVDGEELVVGLGGDQIALRREQFDPHQRRGDAGDQEKEQGSRPQIENANAFVIGREQPRSDAMIDAEIIDRRHLDLPS